MTERRATVRVVGALRHKRLSDGADVAPERARIGAPQALSPGDGLPAGRLSTHWTTGSEFGWCSFCPAKIAAAWRPRLYGVGAAPAAGCAMRRS
jgi:hypothetical protein